MQLINRKSVAYQNSTAVSTLLGINDRPFEPSVVPGAHRHKEMVNIRNDQITENFDLQIEKAIAEAARENKSIEMNDKKKRIRQMAT